MPPEGDGGSLFDGVESWLHDVNTVAEDVRGTVQTVFGGAQGTGSPGPVQGPTPSGITEDALMAGKGMGIFLLVGGALIIAYLLFRKK